MTPREFLENVVRPNVPQVVVTTDGGELRYVEQIVAAALIETEMSRLKI